MKLLFVYPNNLMVNKVPLGVAYLSAILRQNGHEVSLFDATFYRVGEKTDDDMRHASLQVKESGLELEWEPGDVFEDFSAMLERVSPDAVLYNVTENMWPLAKQMLVVSCEYWNIVGGILPTVEPQWVAENEFVDTVCVGEGERKLLRILDERLDGVCDDVGPWCELDSLPFQDWSPFSSQHILRPLGGRVYRTGNYMISRGCPHRCTFCVNHVMRDKGTGQYHREMGIGRAIDEIEHLTNEYGLELTNFHDENFLMMSPQRMDEFVSGYKRRVGLPFSIVTRVETISHETMRKIVDAGCINISMSIESGNYGIRRNMLHRYMSNDTIERAFYIAKQYGIRVSTSNIIGIPGEGRGEVFDTIRLNKQCAPDSATVNTLYPYRGTWIHRHCVDNGYLDKDGAGEGVRAGSILTLPTISAAELAGIQRCFQLYMRFPESCYGEIKKAETDDTAFAEWAQRYREEFPDAG